MNTSRQGNSVRESTSVASGGSDRSSNNSDRNSSVRSDNNNNSKAVSGNRSNATPNNSGNNSDRGSMSGVEMIMAAGTQRKLSTSSHKSGSNSDNSSQPGNEELLLVGSAANYEAAEHMKFLQHPLQHQDVVVDMSNPNGGAAYDNDETDESDVESNINDSAAARRRLQRQRERDEMKWTRRCERACSKTDAGKNAARALALCAFVGLLFLARHLLM